MGDWPGRWTQIVKQAMGRSFARSCAGATTLREEESEHAPLHAPGLAGRDMLEDYCGILDCGGAIRIQLSNDTI